MYIIGSTQIEAHSAIKLLVSKYLVTQYQRPIAPSQCEAFEKAQDFIKLFQTPIILDSGCGTGESTIALAQRFPSSPVIGVDRSEVRLSVANHKKLPKNLAFVRARLEDFWRLALKANWNIERHFLFYPNPYPKPSQIKRRFYGHPVFRTLIKLSRHLEVRSNLQYYVEDFSYAFEVASGRKIDVEQFSPKTPISNFEKKYQATGESLFRLCLELESNS